MTSDNSLNHRRIFMIHGSGRSGTTLLATLLHKHWDVDYKNEPFSPRHNAPYNSWIESQTEDTDDALSSLLHLDAKSYHDLDIPPFTSTNSTVNKFYWQLHRAGYKGPLLAKLYGLLVRPSRNADILIKDVWAPTYLIETWLKIMPVEFISIIRNPYAAVASALKGEKLGLFGIEEHVRTKVEQLLVHYKDSLSLNVTTTQDMDRATLEAWRWRLEAEPSLLLAKATGGQVVRFEDLALDPEAVVKSLSKNLNKDFVASESTTPSEKTSKSKVNEKNYFATNRSAEQALNAWKEQLDQTQRDAISRVWQDSSLDAFAEHWS